MKKLVTMSKYPMALALVLLVLLGWTSSASAQATPVETVRAFFDALNRGDKVTAFTLVNADGDYIENADTPFDHRHNLRVFVDEVGSGEYSIEVLRAEQTGPNTVAFDITGTGPEIPPLPHPFVMNCIVTIENGRIEKMVAVFSEQTLQDILALSEPGMPTTGTATEQNILAALVGSTLRLLVGLSLVRRFRSSII